MTQQPTPEGISVQEFEVLDAPFFNENMVQRVLRFLRKNGRLPVDDAPVDIDMDDDALPGLFADYKI